MEVDEYFAQVQAADDQASARFDQIRAQLGELESGSDPLATLRDVYSQQVATLGDLVDQLDALRPPDEVKDEHDAAVEALKRSIEVTQESSEAASRASTLDEVSAFLERNEVAEADHETSRTCMALEATGMELGITVDLDC
jgi:multidrug efflux pump subunit AcrA (membrane-fusion protein)